MACLVCAGALLLGACRGQRGEREGRGGAKADPLGPVQTRPLKTPDGGLNQENEAPLGAVSLRPGYLLVLGSFPLHDEEPGSVPSEVRIGPPASVHSPEGFPRAANPSEARALRSGYGAWLAGVCADRKSAEEILLALRAEVSEAYLKFSEEPVVEACPRVNEVWKLGHELVLATQSDHPDSQDAVRDLLRRGAPVDFGHRSGTPLNLAAYNNDVGKVRLLLSAGAKVNFPGRAAQEESTLELALRTPYGEPLELVKLLVAHGADIHAATEGAEADPGSTVEIAAARRCDPLVLEFLYSKGMRRGSVAPEEVCRDRKPPTASESDRLLVQALVAGGSSRGNPMRTQRAPESP